MELPLRETDSLFAALMGLFPELIDKRAAPGCQVTYMQGKVHITNKTEWMIRPLIATHQPDHRTPHSDSARLLLVHPGTSTPSDSPSRAPEPAASVPASASTPSRGVQAQDSLATLAWSAGSTTVGAGAQGSTPPSGKSSCSNTVPLDRLGGASPIDIGASMSVSTSSACVWGALEARWYLLLGADGSPCGTSWNSVELL